MDRFTMDRSMTAALATVPSTPTATVDARGYGDVVGGLIDGVLGGYSPY
jgi:hypothetical protein